MRRLWLLALPLFTLVAPAHAAPDHAEIAFVSDGTLWASRADGSERRLLVAGKNLGEPAWSPDGSRLAYVSESDDASRLMLLDADGSRAVTPLRKGVNDHSPAWSPGGTALVFSRFSERNERYRTSIVVRDLASGAEHVLVAMNVFPGFEWVTQPDWSPDGATIAYTHSRPGGGNDLVPHVRTVAAGGGSSRLLIRDAQAPDWSPDGSRLAFAGVRDRNGSICSSDECWFAGEIYTAAADGSDLIRLTDNEGDDSAPRWSPDGSRILFASDRNQPSRGGIWTDAAEVYSVAADGSCLTWLTNGTPASAGGTWRPGSGGRFDPGSCDPESRAPRLDPPRLPRLRGGLWLGAEYRGLLLSGASPRHLSYDDCSRFDGCPGTLGLGSEPACRPRVQRFLPREPRRRFRMRGALVLWDGPDHSAYVLSGPAVTYIRMDGATRLAEVRRVVRGLRPYRASSARGRLAAPRSC